MAGCGGPAFRVQIARPAAVERTPGTPLRIETNLLDPTSVALARAVAERLVAWGDVEVVAGGATEARDAVRIELVAVRTSEPSQRIESQSLALCDPSGPCYERTMPRVVDVTHSRLSVRVAVRDPVGRTLVPARSFEVDEVSDDPMGAELRLRANAARHIAGYFSAHVERIELPVEALPNSSLLDDAIASPDASRCASLRALDRPGSPTRERAAARLGAGQCELAVWLTRGELEHLEAAHSDLVQSMRLAPRETAARALDELERRRASEVRRQLRRTVPSTAPTYEDAPQ